MFIGCGSNQSARNVGEFESYLAKFEADFAVQNGFGFKSESITIKTGELDRDKLAICELRPSTAPTITVNTVHWKSLSAVTKEIVLYHEFGHCLLHRKHNNNPGVGRDWESVMEQRPQELRDYLQFRNEYMKELFQSTTSTPDK